MDETVATIAAEAWPGAQGPALVAEGLGRRLSALSYVALQQRPIHGTFGAVQTVSSPSTHLPGALMLHYAVVFFVIALVAALFGFGGIAAGAVGIAQVLFVVFLVMAVISFLFGVMRKKG
jgi:uncharacterized membrane protein YtjA (UPF0391 family)